MPPDTTSSTILLQSEAMETADFSPEKTLDHTNNNVNCLDNTVNVNESINSVISPNCTLHQRNISMNGQILKKQSTSETIRPTSVSDKGTGAANDAGVVATKETDKFVPRIRWPDLIVQISLHAGCVYGFGLLFFSRFYTFLWFMALLYGSGFGITAGAHRLWSHKSYKAKWPLRLFLMFLFSIAGQRDAYTWAHDHRVHHKYSETDADPHNAKRGFFFSHVGWLVLTPHPDVVAKRQIIDMSDLESDPIVMWQKRIFIPVFATFVILMPTLVPWYFWNESLWIAFWTCFICRFVVVLNIAFFVNSAAHMWGNKPYDKNISPVENLSVAIAAMGEGWHNYHHVFPWDYKTSELGDYTFNFTTGFIDAFAKIGWAYDRKYVSSSMIARRAARCGDGTHYLDDESAHENPLWGYGDKDILKEDEEDLKQMSG